jgi:RND family efflux transporter MFP subunit
MKTALKYIVMAAGSTALVAAATLAQDGGRAPARSNAPGSGNAIDIPGRLIWLAKSDLSAKHEGVLNQMEFREGMRVEEGQEIGRLDDTLARLTVAKQQQQVNLNTSQRHKADAQRRQSMTVLARMKRANSISPNAHSKEELDKAAADVDFADALVEESEGKKKVDEADLDLARASLDQHVIKAPFTGVIIERLKNPGESVRANEPVVRLGKTDSFQFHGWMPIEYVQNVRVGDVVEFRPVVDGANVPLESQVFQGKLTAIGPEVSSVQRTEIRVFAEVINPPQKDHPELELYEGIQGVLGIVIVPDRAPAPAVGDRSKRTSSGTPVATSTRAR